jgi:DNA mismatch endonuclease (patch repair protein)
MRAIRNRDTKPELAVRRFLHSRGLRYRLHVIYPAGLPDLVFAVEALVFVNGCFCLGCV